MNDETEVWLDFLNTERNHVLGVCDRPSAG
jgi:hypothetical protein